MKKILCFLVLCLIIVPSYADTVYPTSARYVIVNPNGRLKASSTFLLDTKTGKTWQLVVDANGVDSWQQMEYDWYKQDGAYGGKTLKAPLVIAP